ncbi:FecCD family ABC transporter permease [Devosia nitrariae]|uniref:Iron ABC transporter permease n=1 Tax=Devosia nitrariae TaxID=2071872 RepID=A0ABQ5WE79_9HYPH|nr:iron chelate uptake ABC transporter family permease subunit [Devosia nitrariae]GLQ57886.1 iron ABC transporter permease [Devosia nitrariae]
MTVLAGSDGIHAIRRSLAARRRRVTVILLVALLVAITASLYFGDYPVAPADIVRSLLSPVTGDVNKGVDFIVLSVRLPRTVLAILTGIAFALSGAIFQTLLRNPLASPDIIGISHGASAAAVVCIVVLGISGIGVSLGALAGALATALAIYGLAWRGGVTAYRIVLVGIGMAAIMSAVISYLFTRARLNEVQEALAWLVGSLNAASLNNIIPLAAALAVLTPATIYLVRGLDVMQLGDDAAMALGNRVEWTRLGLILVAVGHAAFATAAVGPVAFVAFVSGPIARFLLAGAGGGFLQSALVGATVMLGSDMVAQHALPATQLPVGVVTGIFGAGFLLWLLAASSREGRVA